jgi:hypothetical protein|tara:strand:- start:1327 stop:2202 length:876 start_codon:yes stop_codon:yes gene_type:complete
MAISDVLNTINAGKSAVGSALNLVSGLTGSGADGGQSKFSINNINSAIGAMGGLARSPLFLTTINPPPALAGANIGPQALLCSSANLPGKQVTTHDHRRLGYGTVDRRVMGSVMPDVSMTFFVGNNGEPLTFFNSWSDNIMNTDAGPGAEGRSSSNVPTFGIRFRNEYITTIDIAWYDSTSNEVIKYTLHECFPMQIGDVSLAWADNDAFASVAVNFTYRYYTLSTSPRAAPSMDTGFLSQLKNGLGVINKLSSTRIAGFGINDLLNPNLVGSAISGTASSSAGLNSFKIF